MKYEKPTYEKLEAAGKNNFFVRLCYGYVEHTLGMKTEEMTTSEVIQEFLNSKGYKSPRDFFDKGFRGKEKQQDATQISNKDIKDKQREQSQKMVDDTQRIKYDKHLTKEWLQQAISKGQNGMGEMTAKLFNDDSYTVSVDETASTSTFGAKDNIVNMKPKNLEPWDSGDFRAEYQSWYHENWHAIDYNYGDFIDPEIPEFSFMDTLYFANHPKKYDEQYGERRLSSDYVLSTGKTFNDTLITEYRSQKKNGFIELVKQDIEADKQKLDKNEIRRKYGDISDIVSGGEKSPYGVCGLGHRKSYWDKRSNKARGREAFAEIASSKATNPESYETIKKYFPKTVAAFEEIYKKLESGEIKQNENRKNK